METQSQDFRLTWVNYSQKLTESFHKFLTSEILCNVTLWVHNGTSSTNDGIGGGPTGSNSIKAHQAILSACSPWFEEVLSQSQHPHPVIILKDVRYQDLKNIIRFIYTGEVFVPQHELKDFLRTAELLEIKGLLKDADDPAWSGLSSLFQPSPMGHSPLIQQNQQQGATVTNQQLLAAAQVASAATSPTSILAGNLAAAAAAAQQQQNIVNLVNTVPTVPVSSLLLPNSISDGTTSINDLVSQIKVPVSLTSCQKLLSAAANASVSTASGSNTIVSGGLISTGMMDGSSTTGNHNSSGATLMANHGGLTTSSITTAVQHPTGRRRKARNHGQISAGSLTNLVMDQQTIRDGISGQQIILQQPSSGGTGINSHNQHPTIVTTSGNYLSSAIAKRQRLGLATQASELVETHHLVVTGDHEPGGSLLSHGSVGDDDAVSWIEEVASTGSATNTLGGGAGANTTPGGTTESPNHTTTLSPAEWVATGISDCGAFKRLWAERYLCYNLGREIICLLCFCRFTQFKKFNLERHMKNKHPQMLSLNEATRKQILERYVARYINHVTSQKDASGNSCNNNLVVGTSGSATALHPSVFTNSVGGGHSVMGTPSAQHDVASEILSIGPIQLDDLSQTDLVTPITITASASGQQILTTASSTASGRGNNMKSISSTNSTTCITTSASIRDLTTTRSSGGTNTTSLHLATSKQEPLTSIVVIKTEAGSMNSANLIGVSDEDDCNTDNDMDLGTNSNLDKHSESNGEDPNVITTCDGDTMVDGESHSIVVQRSSGNVVTSTEIVGQQPPEDLMQNVECELEEPEGEILLVK